VNDLKKYDIAILGGGPGGYVSAIKASQLGAKVVIIEKESPGGLCLNWGCIPTKTMLISARHYRDLLRSEEFGIVGVDTSNAKIDWKLLLDRKDKVVGKLVSGINMLFKKNNIDFINGEGIVTGNNQISVNDELIQFTNLIIATGASPKIPNIEGIETAIKNGVAIDHKGIYSLESIPSDIVILGSEVYAVEFATLFNSIGSKVTVITENKSLLQSFDGELSQVLERQLKKDGVKIISEADLNGIKDKTLTYRRKNEEKEISSEYFIYLTGLKPNIESLDKLDITKNDKGFIQVDTTLRTNIDGVYAVGDVNGNLPLAHVASSEGIVAVENILGIDSKINYNLSPKIVYSFPEIASVGITETQAKEMNIDYSIGKFPLAANGMSIAEGETNGFVKVVSDNTYGEIIGVQIASAVASEMISKAASLMQLEATVYDLAKVIHPHPTFSEAMLEAAFSAIDKPIHM